jgi:lipopolysaccharide/colanic/teichoic acid biosynthesis glycosyltransferase
VSLSRWQLIVKRGLDVTVASVSLLFAAPVLAIAALAIKLQDRGPVLFRQRRVGRDGRTFEVLKLRTMVPDAEDRLSEVTGENLRRDGPLFKATDDPRRTRVGRVLEATSLDELPQLINVLLGTMSLVGPRPALPDEVAKFDDELLERHSVRPGITGLWQVEARDNPSFDAYRRLDLFYVENWSVTLDLAILFETFQAVLARLLRGPVSHLETGYGARDRSTAA